MKQCCGMEQIADGTVTIKGGQTEATVAAADVEACKSTVVHVIDSVLVPCPPQFSELMRHFHKAVVGD